MNGRWPRSELSELALQEWPEVTEPVAPIWIDADGVYPICCFVNPGCWCHMCALISALLSIGCVSDAIMAVDDPLPLVLALQHVIIASAQSHDRPVLLDEVASAMARLIADPPLTPFFQADQDPIDDLLLVFDGLLAQDGVNIRELLWAAVGSPDEESGADGALAPQEPGTERGVPFLRVASAGLPEVLDNLGRGRFAGRFITRLTRVLTLVDLGAGAGWASICRAPSALRPQTGVTPCSTCSSLSCASAWAHGHCTSRTVASAVDGTSMWHDRDVHVASEEAGDAYGGFAGRGRIALYVREFILEDE